VSVLEQMRLAGEGGFGGSLMIAERAGLIAASVNVSKRKFKNICRETLLVIEFWFIVS
jgi:hypothetical protein